MRLVPEEIAPDLYFIKRGWLNGNHFVYTGARPVLIDAGYLAGLEDTLAALAELEVDPAQVERIILTHTHCDHVGAAPAVKAASGCRVAAHPISRHHLVHKDAWATWWRYYDQEAEFFDVEEEIEDGRLVSVGPYRFLAVHAPGHAAGQICLFETKQGFLLSADALWDGDLGALTPRIEGADCAFRALDSLDKLAKLGAKRVYPGHGDPFDDVAGAIDKTRAKLARFIEDPKAQGWDQVKKIFLFTLMMKPGLPASSLFHNLTEAPWFEETIELFFRHERPRRIFDTVVEELIERGLIKAEGALLEAVIQA